MATSFPGLPREPANAQVPREPEGTGQALPGAAPTDEQPGSGKTLFLHVTELVSRKRHRAAREARTREFADGTRQAADKRKNDHPGGNRPWPLRLSLPVGGATEAVTAYVGTTWSASAEGSFFKLLPLEELPTAAAELTILLVPVQGLGSREGGRASRPAVQTTVIISPDGRILRGDIAPRQPAIHCSSVSSLISSTSRDASSQRLDN
jgi:hypothetical protein